MNRRGGGRPTRVRLVHWNEHEAAERAERLRALGHEVEVGPVKGSAGLRELRERPPDAVVIDFSRLPSSGRDVALALRLSPATRQVPLVFVGGDSEKVARVTALLPDATVTGWEAIGRDLRLAIKRPPRDPIVPASGMAGYSGRPLVAKLGIKPGAKVALLAAPDGFADTLGALPPGVRLDRKLSDRCDLVMLFCRTRADLERGVRGLASRIGSASVWIAWPKKTSRLASDLFEREVRAVGLASGLVDYKVCAIDVTWSGLLFARRREARR